jgi:hypothetical protein
VSTSEISRLKRDINILLARGTGRVIGERLNDDLPCWFCDSIGGVVIVRFEERICDVCRSCANELGLNS